MSGVRGGVDADDRGVAGESAARGVAGPPSDAIDAMLEDRESANVRDEPDGAMKRRGLSGEPGVGVPDGDRP